MKILRTLRGRGIIALLVLTVIVGGFAYMLITAPPDGTPIQTKTEAQKKQKKEGSIGREIIKWKIFESIVSDELP